jgi:aldehyde dehydrogenase (NAD+)
VINIAPWNYPVVISLLPLAGAIAAGCTCVLKPSEHNPTVAALLTELIAKYLDPDAYTVINGAAPETTRLLELKWDHIFFTGGNRVGRIIAAAAAKYVTPITLELGGKSPVFIDAGDVDLEIAARRVLWGKIQNAGQVCVAPDYILVPRTQQEPLIAAFKKAYDSFWPYPKGPLDEKSELANVNITPTNQARIQKLIAGTKGTIVMGGKSEGKRIAPAIIKDVKEDDLLMEDEIFGPVLPIVPVDDVDDAIRVIRDHSTPLVIYVFTENDVTRNLFIQKTRSGQITFNDTFQQLAVHEIPFGGCGESGYGSYFGKYTFDTFTHFRGSINVPFTAEPFMALRYPPYTEEAYNSALTAGSRAQIPDA